MQQHDRRAVADRRVIQADAVDLGVAGVLAGDRGRRRRQRLPQRLGHGDAQRSNRQKQQQDRAHRHPSCHGRRIIVPWAATDCSAQASGNVSRHTTATTRMAFSAPKASPASPYSTGATAPPPIVPV